MAKQTRGDVLLGRDGRVLRVTINRPGKHNALSRSVLAELQEAFQSARDDAGLACVVLTGAGDRYFAAGGDLRDLAKVRTEQGASDMVEESRAALDAVRTFPLPVIAVLNGDALGGGAELALACDMRVMREGAGIGYVQGRLAITTGWGGGTDLAMVVGPARALRMTARCEVVPAATALAWGLVDAVAPADGLDAAVQDFIAPILKQSGTVLRGFKAQALAARRGLSFEERRAVEQREFVKTWMHEDHWSAVDRFLSSRA
jgi:enoyl-CoA hydratase/carnithine racemase